MGTTYDWAAPGTYTAGNLITGNGTSGDLKNLASTASALGPEVNNEGGTILAGLELKIRCASSPTGYPGVRIFFITAPDSTNYEDGAAGNPGTVPLRIADVLIPVRLVSTQQRIAVGPVVLPNCKFKTLLYNGTGQALTNTDNENVLSYRTWNSEGN